MFKDINEAYSIISDPDKRRRYDMGAYDPSDPNGGGGFPGGMNIDPNEIFKMFFGGASPGGAFSFAGDDDMFSAFGGGGSGSGGMGGMGGFPGGFSFMSGGGMPKGGRGGRGGRGFPF